MPILKFTKFTLVGIVNHGSLIIISFLPHRQSSYKLTTRYQLSRDLILRTAPAAAAVLFAQAAKAYIFSVGTILFAIISRLTTVNLPHVYLGWLLHQVSEDTLVFGKLLATSLLELAAEKRHVPDTEPAWDDCAFGAPTIRRMPQSVVATGSRSYQLFDQYNNAATAFRKFRIADPLIG